MFYFFLTYYFCLAYSLSFHRNLRIKTAFWIFKQALSYGKLIQCSKTIPAGSGKKRRVLSLFGILFGVSDYAVAECVSAESM